MRVKGDSMIPEFNEGEIAIINPHLEIGSGDYVIAKNDEEEATFKQLKQTEIPRFYILSIPNIRISG